MYDPKTNKFPYPERTDVHYLPVKKKKDYVFDKDYPYVDNSKYYRRRARFIRFLLWTVVWLVATIRLGLRIKGKKNLKIHKEELKGGAVSICNHVHMWDYIAIMKAIRPRKPHVLVWDQNVTGENSFLCRYSGGIPVPVNDIRANVSFVRQTEKMINDGGWLHVYPESTMWEYYAKIRPFKKGASYFAIRTHKPIVPFVITYRKPGWIRRKIFKQIALLTLNVGEPIYPNYDLPKDQIEEELTRRSHATLVKMAGIEDNLYEPIFNDSKRIDYYTTEYGIGYKGSH